MPAILERFKDAFSIFKERDPTTDDWSLISYGSSADRSRNRLRLSSERSMITSVYNQIAVDCSTVNINHVRLDKNGRFSEIIDGSLNQIFALDANIDQTGRSFIRDLVISMLDEGVVALVPTYFSKNVWKTDSYKVYESRVGKIVEWFPRHVRVEVYDDNIGEKRMILLEKRFTPIIENPFYTIMNEPNSTYKRLIRILNQIDRTNKENSSGKLNLIIQFPYAIRSEARKTQSNARRQEIVDQLIGSKYGIAYTDGTEKIIQLNRSLENNLWEQAKDLKTDLFNQLGFSPTIFDGSADEKTLLNYNNRTIEPILSAITEEIERKWVSRTARAQGQAIRFYKDPFKLVPVSQLAEIADKFTRNEIMTSNEIRSVIGLKPSDDPKADKLINSNLNQLKENEQSDQLSEIQNE